VEAFCYRKKKAQKAQARRSSQGTGSTGSGGSERSSASSKTQEILMLLCCLTISTSTGVVGSVTQYSALTCFATGSQSSALGPHPVAHMTTICTLLVVASIREWSIYQLDMKNAFLNGELREDIYICPLPGYSVPEGMVCHLHRSFYDLKQAPRA
jgi:hypothetical protein